MVRRENALERIAERGLRKMANDEGGFRPGFFG